MKIEVGKKYKFSLTLHGNQESLILANENLNHSHFILFKVRPGYARNIIELLNVTLDSKLPITISASVLEIRNNIVIVDKDSIELLKL
jgi:hypothetical protein